MTVFLRVLEPSAEQKPDALLRSVRAASGLDASRADTPIFDVPPIAFRTIPGSPFAYWVSDAVRAIFTRLDRFGVGARSVKQGLASADDFRFLRNWWEMSPARSERGWFGFAKGGRFSPFYADVHLRVNWGRDGAEIKSNVNAEGVVRSNVWMLRDTASQFFFRAGLSYPARPHGSGWFCLIPRECIFSHNGPMAFVPPDEMLAYLGLLNASVFHHLVQLQMARGHGTSGQTMTYEVGMVASTPVPTLSASESGEIACLARRAWSLMRMRDTTNEGSHAFLLPRELSSAVDGAECDVVEQELASIHNEINDRAFSLYGIGADDRAAIEASFERRSPGIARIEENVEDAEEDEVGEDDTRGDSGEGPVISYLVGVAFARFDPRLATGERPIPPEPDPFDPLPARSPGMYPEGEEPPDRPDILVDDEGHPDDLPTRAAAVADRVRIDTPSNLRPWLAKEFFPLHIKMYSKSRRKAPIYWQLATPSASYSVWLYIHAFTKDTLFRVQNDYVTPKLAHEQRRLESLTAELRDKSTPTQRKELAAQESFVDELRGMLDEVKRVAPLWNPNLDDGVIINFAPLWRLVPQHKAWQKELRSTWDALCDGKYDWAHLAMHLWPERVVPKCATDRSFAIAHGLEDVFWIEGTDGKWTARKTPTRPVADLIAERTSAAVKSALASLLEAPAASGTATKTPKTKKGKASA